MDRAAGRCCAHGEASGCSSALVLLDGVGIRPGRLHLRPAFGRRHHRRNRGRCPRILRPDRRLLGLEDARVIVDRSAGWPRRDCFLALASQPGPVGPAADKAPPARLRGMIVARRWLLGLAVTAPAWTWNTHEPSGSATNGTRDRRRFVSDTLRLIRNVGARSAIPLPPDRGGDDLGPVWYRPGANPGG